MAVFMNQKGISVERERPIERGREGGEGRHGVSRCGGCTCIMTTQISKKPIGPARRLLEIYYPRLLRSARVIKRCFCPRRSVLRPFRRGAPRQRPANPMENRPRERRRKEKEREKEREREERSIGRRAISCRNIRRRKFRYQATIRYLFVAVTSSEK